MDIQASKIELAKMILKTEDGSIIKKIRNIFSGKADTDFYSEFTEDQKLEIQLASTSLTAAIVKPGTSLKISEKTANA